MLSALHSDMHFVVSGYTRTLYTLYDITIYIYSPTRYTMRSQGIRFNQHLSLALHVSDLIGPSSERFVQAVLPDFGMWYYCAYYSTRPAITAGRVE